jgi:hypothetical protein
MSIDVSTQVWKRGPRDRSERFVLLAIADNANDEGYAFPLVQTIAAKCLMSIRTVQRVLKNLTDDGWIAVEASPKNYKANAYQIDLLKLSHANLSHDKTSTSHVTKTTFSCDKPGEHILINSQEQSENSQYPTSQKKLSLNPPAYIDRAAWLAFVEMRKQIRKPLTDRACELTWKKLAKMQADGVDITAALEQSTMSCYQGVFAPKEDYAAKGASKNKILETGKNLASALRRLEDDHGGAGGDVPVSGSDGHGRVPRLVLAPTRTGTSARSARSPDSPGGAETTRRRHSVA